MTEEKEKIKEEPLIEKWKKGMFADEVLIHTDIIESDLRKVIDELRPKIHMREDAVVNQFCDALIEKILGSAEKEDKQLLPDPAGVEGALTPSESEPEKK